MTAYLVVAASLALGQVNAAPQSPTPVSTPNFAVPISAGTASPWTLYPNTAELPQAQPAPVPDKVATPNGASNCNGSSDKNGSDAPKDDEHLTGHFFHRFIQAYCNEFKKKDEANDNSGNDCPNGKNGDDNGNGNGKDSNGNGKDSNGNGKDSNGNGNCNGSDSSSKEPARRALPSPWSSPPFPGSEYQGYPLIGVPNSDTVYPFMKALYSSPWGDAIKDTRIKFDGWVTAAGAWGNSRSTNAPASYWIVPNSLQLDQMLFRFQREVNSVQTDHNDWGFRSTTIYGMDYRYTTAGGWGSDQLLKHNLLYGWDPTEQYFDFYTPFIGEGAIIRVGRWIACPDIETQWAPDNYLGSHSILFTFDTYTQTGVMWTQRLSEQVTVQAAIHAGTDMAPWYPGAIPTGAFGVRWVAKDNNDAVYAWLNAINNAEFRHFEQYGQPLGHDNFNYVVATWEHRFNKDIHTKTEAYYMWERNAEVGGTPSAGPIQPYGGGGGDGTLIPGLSQAYGVLNYTMFGLTKKDYLTVRNEWWKDETGFRAGFAGNYTSHTIGLSHSFNSLFQIRPEIGYYRNWNQPAFDLGTKQGIWIAGFDMTLRF